MPRRYIHLSHWDDRFELLIDGPNIIRIQKFFTDSGMIRTIDFDELPNSLKDQVINEINNGDYEI